MRRQMVRMGLGVLLALGLAGCGVTTGIGGEAVIHPTPTATPKPKPRPTPTPTPTAGPQVNALSACDSTLAASPGITMGDLAISMSIFGVHYPGRKLPDNLPLKPYQLPAAPGPALDQQLPPTPEVYNARAMPFAIEICNHSSAQTHTLAGVAIQIASLTPMTGQVNDWAPGNGCATYYSRAAGFQGGGCGGANGPADNCLVVTFPDNAGNQAIAPATGNTTEDSCQTMAALPVKLPPNQQIALTVMVMAPATPGAYSYALGISADGASMIFSQGQAPLVLAANLRLWDGSPCQQSAMLAQIPPTVNPPTYYVCPEP